MGSWSHKYSCRRCGKQYLRHNLTESPAKGHLQVLIRPSALSYFPSSLSLRSSKSLRLIFANFVLLP